MINVLYILDKNQETTQGIASYEDDILLFSCVYVCVRKEGEVNRKGARKKDWV